MDKIQSPKLHPFWLGFIQLMIEQGKGKDKNHGSNFELN